jgi:hypothetical protein
MKINNDDSKKEKGILITLILKIMQTLLDMIDVIFDRNKKEGKD